MRKNKKEQRNVRIQKVQLHREFLQQRVHGAHRGRDANRFGICGTGKGTWCQHQFPLRRRKRKVCKAYLHAGSRGDPELLERYKDKVVALAKDVFSRYKNVRSVNVFGEMFGGTYPHKDVQPNRKLSLIQKGVCYTPEHEFYGFDIYVINDDGGRYLPVDEVNELFDKHGFFYARTLFKGTLGECLKYPNAFQSKIAEWLGFPAIEDNICEGIVIRPVVPMYLRNGSRVLIKSKNKRFAEKKSVKKRNKLFAEPVPYSEALKALIPEVEAYVTEQRLANVVSHIGEVHVPKDFGKIMGLFSKDVLEDFLKEHGGEYGCLEKSEQKLLNKELNKLSTEMVKKVYMGQAYILD